MNDTFPQYDAWNDCGCAPITGERPNPSLVGGAVCKKRPVKNKDGDCVWTKDYKGDYDDIYTVVTDESGGFSMSSGGTEGEDDGPLYCQKGYFLCPRPAKIRLPYGPNSPKGKWIASWGSYDKDFYIYQGGEDFAKMNWPAYRDNNGEIQSHTKAVCCQDKKGNPLPNADPVTCKSPPGPPHPSPHPSPHPQPRLNLTALIIGFVIGGTALIALIIFLRSRK